MDELVKRDVTYLEKKRDFHAFFFLANPVFDILEDATISLLRTLDVAKLVPSS